MTALGLLLLVITLPATHGAHSAYSLVGMIAFEGAMLAIGAVLIGGKHLGMPDHHHGIMLGAAAGVLFGVSDIAIKALTGADGIGGVLGSPWLAVTLMASCIAFYASARGMQEGEAVPVIAATSTAANVSCILGGIIVFGDPMPTDAVGISVQIFAFVLVVAAALVTPPRLEAAAANATLAHSPVRGGAAHGDTLAAMLPLRELLRELDLTVVAGEAGLDRAVRWVHISELDDPTPWLSGGELLLTTGLQLGDDAQQREYVARLADHGLSRARLRRRPLARARPGRAARGGGRARLPAVRGPVRAAVHRDHREGVLAARQRAVRRAAARARPRTSGWSGSCSPSAAWRAWRAAWRR